MKQKPYLKMLKKIKTYAEQSSDHSKTLIAFSREIKTRSPLLVDWI
jgi:hypothetical protein